MLANIMEPLCKLCYIGLDSKYMFLARHIMSCLVEPLHGVLNANSKIIKSATIRIKTFTILIEDCLVPLVIFDSSQYQADASQLSNLFQQFGY